MIFSKAALQAAMLCAGDKSVPALSVVMLEADGTVVAANGKAMIAISPVTTRIRESVPLPDKEELTEVAVISVDTAKELVKAVPKDTQFKGLLEHVSVRVAEAGKPPLIVTTNDGKRKSETTVRRLRDRGLDWRPVFQEAFVGADYGNGLWIANRMRLRAVIDTLEKVCPYSGDFSPVFWIIRDNGIALIRVENELTGQRAVITFRGTSGAEAQEKWLPLSVWERRLASGFKAGAAVRRVFSENT